MKLKPFKIKVESKSHSREIQEWLFSLGYKWASGRRTPHHLDFLYLFFSKEIRDEDPTISWSSNSRFFMDSNLPEAWFYDGKIHYEPKPQTQPHSEFWTYRQVAEALFVGTKLQFLDPSKDWIPINYVGLHVHQLDREYPYEVRVKPRYCNGVELDPCLTDYPEKGSYYYYPDPMHVDYYNLERWSGSADDIYWFELGYVYSSIESAAKHGQAMGLYVDSTSSTKPEE